MILSTTYKRFQMHEHLHGNLALDQTVAVIYVACVLALALRFAVFWFATIRLFFSGKVSGYKTRSKYCSYHTKLTCFKCFGRPVNIFKKHMCLFHKCSGDECPLYCI